MRRSRFLPLFGFLGMAALFYAPVLLGLRWFPQGDFTDHFLPFSLFQRAELLAGRLPLWNPYTFSGHPFLADTQAAIYYPLSNLVLGLTLPWGDAIARLYWLQVEAVLHVALAGFFTYLLALDLLGSRRAAFLAGALFAFSGYLTGYPPLQIAVLRSAIWLPLVVWCIRRAFRCGRAWRWWIFAALAYATAFLGGHPQTFLYLSYTVAGWILLQLFAAPRPARPRLLQVGAFYALFLGLVAAQLWPSVEFTALSARAAMDFASAGGGFASRDLWQFVAPGVLTIFSPLFMGLVGLGLAVWGLVAALLALARRSSLADGLAPAEPLFFAVVALIALLASFGANGFLYQFLYRWAPGWDLFRGQERSAYLVAFSLSILAAYGAVALHRLSPLRRNRALAVWAALVAAALALTVVTLGAALEPPASAALWRAVSFAAVAALVASLLVLLCDRVRWAPALLIVVAVAELFAANFSTNLEGAPALPSPETLAVQSAVAAASVPGEASPRAQNQGRVPEDYGMLVRVEDISGSSPLRLARYDGFLRDFPLPRLWRLTGVGAVLTSAEDLYAPTAIVDHFDTPAAPGFLHRVDAPAPRAWVAESLLSVRDEDTLPLLGSDRLNVDQMALLPPPVHVQDRPEGLEDGWLANAEGSSARLEQISPGHLRVHVKAPAGGFLVVSENWMPGWEAVLVDQIGARPVPALRTNLTFIGIPITRGETTVELRYRPASVRFGLAVSLLTALLLAALALPASRNAAARAIRRLRVDRGSVVRVSLLAVVALAFALRVFRLGYAELRGDEALGRLFSMQPLADLIRATIALKEPHPVASYAIQGAWFDLAGHAEFALRFVSVWFGVLAVPLLYILARHLRLARVTALLAAGLLAVSPYAVWHSQDARMYTISLALTIASTVLMLAALDRGHRWAWIGYVAVTWLALQTHYYAAYVIVAQNLFALGRALVNRDERRRLVPWLTAQAATALLYLPWLIAARSTLTAYVGNGDSPGFVSMWLRSLGVFAVGETMPSGQRAAAGLLGGLLALLGAFRLAGAGPVGRRALWLAALYLLVPLVVTWVGALARPIFNERYIIAAFPGFALLVASGLAPAPRGAPRPDTRGDLWSALARAVLGAALALAAVVSLWHLYADPAFTKSSGWRQLAAIMERSTVAASPETTRVGQTFPDPTLWYYYQEPVESVVIPPAAKDQAGADSLADEIAAAGVERVVLAVIPSSNWDDNEIGARALQAKYALSLEVPVGPWRVQVYDRPPASLPPVDVAFASGIRLSAAAVGLEQLIPGDVLPVWLHWTGDEGSLRGGEKITLQLLDGADRVAAQVDQPFGAPDFDAGPARYVVLLPRTLPAGNYRLIAAVYNAEEEGAPRLLTSEGQNYVELGVISSPAREDGLFR